MMRIDKAIRILASFTYSSNVIASNDVNDAIKLGIEALKGRQKQRKYAILSSARLLPGETKE